MQRFCNFAFTRQDVDGHMTSSSQTPWRETELLLNLIQISNKTMEKPNVLKVDLPQSGVLWDEILMKITRCHLKTS